MYPGPMGPRSSHAIRLAIFSDVHGNALAFDAVIQDMRDQEIAASVCLGDAIQGGPQPSEVVARLRELDCPIVMGNADAWLLTGVETGAERVAEAQREIRAWSAGRLSQDERDFIEGFVPTVEVPLPGSRTLLAFHGSPRSFDEFIFPHTPQEEVSAMFEGHRAGFFAGGHTHLQQIRHLGHRTFLNPGSVGLAYRHDQGGEAFRADPWAEYAILTADEDRWHVEFRRIPFDVDALRRIYRESGRPHLDLALSLYRD